MSIVIPPGRIEPPALQTRVWLAPVRAEQFSRFAEVANHLACVKSCNHVSHRIGYVSGDAAGPKPGDILDQDPSGTATVLLTGTHNIALRWTNPFSHYLELSILLQCHPFTLEGDTGSSNFGNARLPSLKIRLLDGAGNILDPIAAEQAAGAAFAMELTTENGGLPRDGGRVGNADTDGPFKYPAMRVNCCLPPNDSYQVATLPSSTARGLRYGAKAGTGDDVHVQLDFSAVRVLQVDINEAPALIVG